MRKREMSLRRRKDVGDDGVDVGVMEDKEEEEDKKKLENRQE